MRGGREGQARGAGERAPRGGMGARAKPRRAFQRSPQGGVGKRKRERERMEAWIAQDKKYTAGRGVEGKLGELMGAERWTSTGPGDTCIEDMEEVGGFFEDTEDAEREHE